MRVLGVRGVRRARRQGFAATVVLLALGPAVLVAPSASADPVGHSSWTTRDDARAPAEDVTTRWSAEPDDAEPAHFNAWTSDGELALYGGDATSGINLFFRPPQGSTLRPGATYRVHGGSPTAAAGRLWVVRGGRMCGQPENPWPRSWDDAVPAVGSLTLHELALDGAGQPTRLSLTYEVSCQVPGGQPGLEGSVAIDASQPAAAVPAAPATPGPVTGLVARTTGPTGGGVNATTLSWAKPAGAHDTVVDLVQSSDATTLPAVLGGDGETRYSGRGTSWRDDQVDFMDTRTYRVTPRGPTGRLGPSTLVGVLGTRLSADSNTLRSTVGRPVQVGGRLTESWDYVDFADVMKGPPVAGVQVRLCRQSSVQYVDHECTTVARTTTDADGRFSFSVVPQGNTLYSVLVPPTSTMVGNISRVINAEVSPYADLRTEGAPAARSTVARLTASRAKAGSRGILRLQRREASGWRTVATRSLGTGKGRVAFTVRDRAPGREYRVVKPGDRRHVDGVSRVVQVRRG